MEKNGIIKIGAVAAFGGYEWQVLDVAEGGRALLITKGLVRDERQYNRLHYHATWADSDMRAWLNGEFLASFGKEDRERILAAELQNKDNPWFGTEGGADTEDKVFLLSLDEVLRYFGDSGDVAAPRRKNSEGELQDDGGFVDDGFNAARAAGKVWWLRTPGRRKNNAANVSGNGRIFIAGSGISIPLGVRPAVWVRVGEKT
jgi:hypothetical protein